jgi:hypothetical protein
MLKMPYHDITAFYRPAPGLLIYNDDITSLRLAAEHAELMARRSMLIDEKERRC